MNKTNPLTPQGSLQEQSKRKSQIRLIIFSILAVHILLLGTLLIQGCKPDGGQAKSEPPPFTPVVDTNPPVPPPDLGPQTNPPAQPFVAPPSLVTTTPPAVVNPPADTLASGSVHEIAKGETFADLAKKYGVSTKAIQQANPGVDARKLKIGQKINIPPKPPGGTTSHPAAAAAGGESGMAAAESGYTVKKGDTLTKIAKATGASVKAIREANGLRTDQLQVGKKLKIPAKAGASGSEGTTVAPPSGGGSAMVPPMPGVGTTPTNQ